MARTEKKQRQKQLFAISTAEPTNWPSDPKRISDVIDFFIAKNLTKVFFNIETCLDVILSIGTTVITALRPNKLYNNNTDWFSFRELIDERLGLVIPLKTEADVGKAVKNITTTIQECCWLCTPAISERPPQFKVYPQNQTIKSLRKKKVATTVAY